MKYLKFDNRYIKLDNILFVHDNDIYLDVELMNGKIIMINDKKVMRKLLFYLNHNQI